MYQHIVDDTLRYQNDTLRYVVVSRLRNEMQRIRLSADPVTLVYSKQVGVEVPFSDSTRLGHLKEEKNPQSLTLLGVPPENKGASPT